MRKVSPRGARQRAVPGWAVVLGLLLTTVLLGWAPVARHVRAAELLQRLSEKAPTNAPRLATEDVTIPGKSGPIRARLYFPAGAKPGRAIVVAHGVHYRGIDERRLVPFARALAESGLTVLTPELSELADYRITASGVEVIRDSVRYLLGRRDHVDAERVGVLGFSFAGGLALVAAQDPETAAHVTSVTSVGGHHDLRRVLRFLIHNEIETPNGLVRQKAHEYGLVVLVYGNLEHFVPAPDLPAMRAGFQAWLHEDQKAARAAAKARTTPEAERLWQLLEKGNLQTLAPELDALLQAQSAALKALSSAGHLKQLQVPVYLLHGSHDTVIPASETDAAHLELDGADHQALVSPLLEHVEMSKTAGLGDKLALVSFMAKLL
ncbi:MAG TPA: alpha/beta fold hydrolase [Polyangiaceae bacterium]|nr:alpha/beta fold hydrolase [Polyangiaceae bacterium]